MNRSKEFVLTVVLTVLCIGAVSVGIGLYAGYPVGDIVRVGAFPERDWLPRRVQEELPRALNTINVEAADVVVLGDSFSRPLLWQGELERETGRGSLTYHYGEVGCINDWADYLLKRDLKPGAVVIVETIERSFVKEMRDLPREHFGLIIPEHPGGKWGPEEPRKGGFITVDVLYNFSLLLNMIHDRGPNGISSNTIRDIPLTTSGLFTNKKSDWLLYCIEDDSKSQWTSEDISLSIANARELRDKFAARGVKFLVMMVPDKSTTYRRYIKHPEPTNEAVNGLLMENQLSPFDLTKGLREGAEKIQDLYLPDDSHLGNDGYRLLGSIVAAALK